MYSTVLGCLGVFITQVLIVGAGLKHPEKRILLDDQTLIQQKLDKLQSMLQSQQAQINELTVENAALRNEIDNGNKGAVYIRWGRRRCNNGSELVYSGFVGGPWYNSHGSGSNPVCLSPDPLWGQHNDHLDTHAAYMYGAEYEFTEIEQGLINENVPCAVCWSPTAVTTLMIPGRNKCYGGWKEEYHGYLAANRGEYLSGIQYTCIDESPEKLDSGHDNQDGVLFFEVEGRCGSLPCPPYVNGREIGKT